MSHRLRPHPDLPAPVDLSIVVDVARTSVGLVLTYIVAGDIAALAIPSIEAPTRTDELWRHTCFEAFVRPDPGDAYVELNFAPSSQWAAYRFAGYRDGMAPAEIAPPAIEIQTTPARLAVGGAVDLSSLPDVARAAWRLGLSAVIEDAAGAKSYWALAHPPGRPDFHHGAGFVLSLPPRLTRAAGEGDHAKHGGGAAGR